MEEFGLSDPADDVREVVQSVANPNRLLEALERLSTLLVMGLEEYLRAFRATLGLPKLIAVGRGEACTSNGDCLTLLLRSIALTLEHVPDSNAACATLSGELLGLASTSLQRTPLLAASMVTSTLTTLAEECLRVILFVVRDDATGRIVSNGFLRDVLGNLEWADGAITRQCFDITCAACDKINFDPPEAVAVATPSYGGGSRKSLLRTAITRGAVLSELQQQLIPKLQSLAMRSSQMTHQFAVREGSLQSLGALAYRATRQRQPAVVAAITTPQMFQFLLDVILDEVNRFDGGGERPGQPRRLDHILTVLLHFATAAPQTFRTELLTSKAKQVFTALLQLATPDTFAKLLDDPFATNRVVPAVSSSTGSSSGSGSASRHTSRFPDAEHNAVIMALLSFIATLPAVPGHSFGRTSPVTFLAVHCWQWEDDVHSFSEYPADQWIVLETAVAQGQTTASVRVRGRSFDVNVHDLKQTSGRNIRRLFVPEYFMLVANGAADPERVEFPIPLADIQLDAQQKTAHRELHNEYLRLMCDFCVRTSNKTVKVLSIWVCASLIHAHLCLCQQPDEACDVQHLKAAQLLHPVVAGMIVDALSAPEEDSLPSSALALSLLDWLLHNQPDGSASLNFTSWCSRYGIPQALQVMTHFSTPDSAQIVVHADMLLQLLEASSSPVKGAAPGETEELSRALYRFNEVRDSSQVAKLVPALEELANAIANAESLTVFEFANAGVALAVVAFLKGIPPSATAAATSNTTAAGSFTTPVKMPVTPSAVAEASGPSSASIKGCEELSRKQRCALLRTALGNNPCALKVLTRNLIAMLPFLCTLPLVESTVSAHAVVLRPINEILTILASLSPRIALCHEKSADAAYTEQRSLLETDLHSLCPGGHRLRSRGALGWACDVCGVSSTPQADVSMRCDTCDFDVCKKCFDSVEVGYEGSLPDHEGEEGIRPGRTFHILSSVGDVEAYFASKAPPSLSSTSRTRTDLYYDGIGRVRMQETLLSVMYRKAFQRKLTTVLEQFENSLLRVDVAAEQAAARHQAVFALVSQASSSALSAETSSDLEETTGSGAAITTCAGSPLGILTPIRGLMFSANRRAGSASPSVTPAAARRLVDQDSAMRGMGRGISIREFGEQCVTKARTYFFHHFAHPTSERCRCGEHDRKSLLTKQPPLLRQKPSEFELQPEVQLLLLLHEFFAPKKGSSTAALAKEQQQPQQVLGPSDTISDEISALILRSLHASAIRVAILPFVFAVPRWVSFVLREAPFLLPVSVRERIARFVCYGARRALAHHIRKLNLNPLRSPGGGSGGGGGDDSSEPIATPFEWHTERCSADWQTGHKFTVNRNSLERDSYDVLSRSSHYRFPVAIEFVGDKGTGVGPTTQWYSLVAQMNFTATNLIKRWRTFCDPSDESSIVVPPEGLFPRCVTYVVSEHDTSIDELMMDREQSKTKAAGSSSVVDEDDLVDVDQSTANTFSLLTLPKYAVPTIPADDATFFYHLGVALGRAFSDHKILPLPLSLMLLEWLRVGPPPLYVSSSALKRSGDSRVGANILAAYRLGIDDVSYVDRGLAKQLQELKKMYAQHPHDGSNAVDDGQGTTTTTDEIEALGLSFSLPGVDDFCLLGPPGEHEDVPLVTHGNVIQYIQRVCECLTFEAAALPIRQLWWGFTDVVQSEGLQVLELEELSQLLLGDTLDSSAPLWTPAEIREVLVPEHGYTADSPQMQFLLEILSSELTPQQQRQFLEFCTGCPRLPLGGVKALGRITVVRRSSDGAAASLELQEPGGQSSIAALPTVNTCFRYLKLPPYPTKSSMKEKLLLAVQHCGQTFELS